MGRISLRLTHKIMAIGLVGLLGLVSFGSIYLSGSRSEDTSRSAAESASAIADLNHRLEVDMLEVRRAEKDFQLRRDEAFSKRHAELSVAVTGELDQLRKLTHATGFTALAEKVDRVGSGFGKYAKEFAAMQQAEIELGLNETLGLSGELRGAVHGIESELKQADNPKLTSGMLMLRRHEKDFMLRRDPKYVEELKKAVADFGKSVAAQIFPRKSGRASKASCRNTSPPSSNGPRARNRRHVMVPPCQRSFTRSNRSSRRSQRMSHSITRPRGRRKQKRVTP